MYEKNEKQKIKTKIRQKKSMIKWNPPDGIRI